MCRKVPSARKRRRTRGAAAIPRGISFLLTSMLRPPRTRVATVVLALLYLLAWGEPAALHPCPMHDGAGVAALPAHADGAAHGAAHAAAHGGHGHDQHAAMAGDHAPASHGDGEHLCQCLGSGCGAGAVAVPTARQQVRWFAVVTRRADPPAAPTALPRALAPRLLPPATGPPALG